MLKNTLRTLAAALPSFADNALTEADIKLGYRFILGRQAESDRIVREKLVLGTIAALRKELLTSPEFASSFARREPTPTGGIPGGDLTAAQVRLAYQLLLGRPAESEESVNGKLSLGTVEALRLELLNSEEFLALAKHELKLGEGALTGLQAPTVGPPTPPVSIGPSLHRQRILLLGTCQLEPLAEAGSRLGQTVNHMIMYPHTATPVPAVDMGGYDAVVVGLTLRYMFNEALEGSPDLAGDMAIARVFGDRQAATALIARCVTLIETKLAQISAVVGGTPTFFMSLFEPSFDYAGLLFDGYEPSSPKQIVRRMNEALYQALSTYPNFKFLDSNEVANSVGRMHLQDDIVWGSSHASVIGEFDFGLDKNRLVAPKSVYETYQAVTHKRLFGDALLSRVIESMAILRSENRVKLIIVDLDDTLWRGVAAEESGFTWEEQTEGWPLGFVEALLYFKRRGGLLAICSKNDEAPTLQRFKEIWKNRISPDDFVSIKINWEAKSHNIAEILAETNLLPGSVVFVDDNPREVEEVRSRFPEIRTLGFDPLDWRRIILRAPEMQVTSITAESAQRTLLVKARVERETQAAAVPREQFLADLQIEQSFIAVKSSKDSGYERGFELLNKTNQFNTTGKRWTAQEMDAFFARGGVFLLSSLKDKTVDNGIIAAAMIAQGELVQTVLSCRVFHLGAEIALGSLATQVAFYQAGGAKGRIVDTGKNFSCHKYFEQLGFEARGDEFVTFEACAIPAWIKVTSVVGLDAELESQERAA